MAADIPRRRRQDTSGKHPRRFNYACEMPRKIASLAGALAAVVLVAAPSAAHARSCGSTGGVGVTPYAITATDTSCTTARRVAARVAKVPSFGGCAEVTDAGRFYLRAPCVVMQFRCKTIARSSSGITVRCRRGDRTVRFRL